MGDHEKHGGADARMFADIRHAEDEAEHILSKAAHSAETIIADAKKQASSRLHEGMKKIEQESAQSIEAAKVNHSKEAEKKLAQAKDIIKKLKQKAQKNSKTAEDLIVKKFYELC